MCVIEISRQLSLASVARCYTAVYKDKPRAFIAVINIHMKARYYRVLRLIVLPDYQGLGVGKRLLNFIAELCTSQIKLPNYILPLKELCFLERQKKEMTNQKGWCISKIGWCVGCNTPHLAKLPLTPFFFFGGFPHW